MCVNASLIIVNTYLEPMKYKHLLVGWVVKDALGYGSDGWKVFYQLTLHTGLALLLLIIITMPSTLATPQKLGKKISKPGFILWPFSIVLNPRRIYPVRHYKTHFECNCSSLVLVLHALWYDALIPKWTRPQRSHFWDDRTLHALLRVC